MGSWIFASILAATGAGAAVQETRRTLSVSATVTASCEVRSLGSESLACTPGTSWTRSTSNWRPRRAPQQIERTASYVTITY